MKFETRFIPRCSHSTVVADLPTLGPVAFLLWGFGRDMLPMSSVQMILIDFHSLLKVMIYFNSFLINKDAFYFAGNNVRSAHSNWASNCLLYC